MAIDRRHILAFGKIDTPFYFYDMDLFRRTVSGLASLSSRYGIKVHYAVKANTEERLLRHISSYGFGADCVSGNEVEYAVSCGFRPENTVFAGVGKSDREILSSLKLGIGTFNCESLQEPRLSPAARTASAAMSSLMVLFILLLVYSVGQIICFL